MCCVLSVDELNPIKLYGSQCIAFVLNMVLFYSHAVLGMLEHCVEKQHEQVQCLVRHSDDQFAHRVSFVHSISACVWHDTRVW